MKYSFQNYILYISLEDLAKRTTYDKVLRD